jgi:opacity protein-like surface antigen
MKHISKYTFSIALTLVSLLVQAQATTEKKDSIAPKMERYGLRLGVDLFKLTRSFYEKEYRGLELVGDYRLTRKHYLAAEIGNEDKTVDEEQLNFTTKGSYIRVGFDFNAYENWLDMENQIYVGLRYGFSTFNHTLNSYSIYNPDQHFGQSPIIVSGEKFDGLTAQWLEVVAGVKAEVFDNIFVGFSFRLNRLVSQKVPNNFDNLYIPGFNKTYNGDFGIGFNYTVSYFIPLYKSKVKAKEEKEEKK